MKAQATDISEGAQPEVVIELFRDRSGNWFASFEQRRAGAIFSAGCTATYTTPAEAIEDASRRVRESK